MPVLEQTNLPRNEPNPTFVTLDSFRLGVITIVDKSRLPKNALEVADDAFLYEDGLPGPRPGVDWFGSVVPNEEPIHGYDYFDHNGSVHIVAVAGGVVYRSTDNANTWTECTGATLTANVDVDFNQSGGYLYLNNGVDDLVLYDGTTVLTDFSGISTPAQPSFTKTGLSGTSLKYYYKVAAVNKIGFTDASPSREVGVGELRDSWGSSDNVKLEVAAVTGATRYDWYISEDDIDYYYLSSTVAPEFKDDGSAIIIGTMRAPTDNTTTGPKVEFMTNVGERKYGVRDPEHPFRIWYSGGAGQVGSFSSAYDGGYIDWQPGGKYRPVHVEDYRDGKGDPYATVWCSSADGEGCILQMRLDEVTIEGAYRVTIPSLYRLPGSRGTNAPGSVVNMLNDYLFLNSQAIYNLGSRAQFLNLLSTDEASANIRPTLRRVSRENEHKIASVFWDAKVLMSVPYGTEENNATIVFDTERQAWLPFAFTIGFSRFMRLGQRLIASRPGDNRLSEISYNFTADYGHPFETLIVTGVIPVTRNRYEFIWIEEAEMEFSNPQGTINIDLNGFDRSRGFVNIANRKLQVDYSEEEGWDSVDWEVTNWDDTTEVRNTFSESSLKRYFNLQRELNAIQWRISSKSVDKKFVLRNLQVWGTDTQAGKPRQWRLRR